MATSGVEELSMRLLEAFYDLADGKLKQPVSMEEATRASGLDTTSTEPNVALRYLLNGSHLEVADETAGTYEINVPGMDKVRQKRGLDS